MTNESKEKNLEDLNADLQLLIGRAAQLGLSRSFAELQYQSVKGYGKFVDKLPTPIPEGKSKKNV